MPVERVGQFLEFRDCGVTPALGIESSNLDACVEEVTRRNWLGVFGSPVFGFEEIDLNFLAKMPHLIQVWFWQVNLRSIDGLYALSDLKYFGVHPNRPELDFFRLPNLETMVWIHNRKDKNVKTLSKLTELNVWHFKPKSKSFAELELPDNLERMRIFWANPNSLEDIPVLSSLKHIEFHRCRNLASLAGLERIAPALESIIISTCGKLQSESFPLEISSLRKVIINDRQIIG